MKASMDGEHSRRLLMALGGVPADAFPEFEALMGWPLPASVLPFAHIFAEEKTPPCAGWSYLDDRHGKGEEAPCPPWRIFCELLQNGEQAVDHFLFEYRIYGLLFGLIGFAEDCGGDIGFVDVGPGGTGGGVFVHNHEVGWLEAKSTTLAGFVQEHYIEWADDVEHGVDESPVPSSVIGALGAAPAPEAQRSKQLLAHARHAQWLVDIFRGEFDGTQKPPSQILTVEGPLRLHYELLASAILGDGVGAQAAVREARDSKGFLTRSLGQRVDSLFAKPETASLGWLDAQRLREFWEHYRRA
jgi:hypothetical protein